MISVVSKRPMSRAHHHTHEKKKKKKKNHFFFKSRVLVSQDKTKYNSPKYRLVVRFTNKDVVAQVS
jgi:large subunit ribosomal protein L5e